MRKDFASGKFSLAELAAKHSIALSSVHRRATNEAWAADRFEAKENSKRIEAKENAIKENSKRIDPHVKVISASVVSRAVSVAAREGTRIGMNASAFVEKTILQTHRLLEGLEALMFPSPGGLTVDLATKLIPQWAAVVRTGREAYRLDDVDPVQPLISLHGTSQMLELVESVEGHWEQSGGGPAAAPSIVTRPAETLTDPPKSPESPGIP